MNRAALALPLALAACVAPRAPAPPPPAPAPRPAPAPAPAPPADWRDRAYTPGDWSYARAGAGSEARYGGTTATALAIACDPGRGQLTLRMARAPAGPLVVRTSYGDVTRAVQSAVSGVQLALAPRDPLLDQIAYSRGRFMLAAGGVELVLPAWPEVARVIEDCR